MKEENRLIVKEKESIFAKISKWFSNLFGGNKKNLWEEKIESEYQESKFIIPDNVEMVERKVEEDENSLSYLYKLSDEQVDKLDALYDNQMEEAKDEILKLEKILQNYKLSIKKFQEELAEEGT